MNEIIESDRINGEDKNVEIGLKIVGPSPPSRLYVPSPIKVHDLRKLIAGNARLPIENLRLILRGKVLHDNKNGNDVSIQLHDRGVTFDFNSFSLLSRY